MCATCYFIKEQYFIDHSDYQKMLDPGNTKKQSSRSYLCIKICSDGKDFYIPLRNNLGNEIRPYGRIGHALPSQKRENAGIDYRYALIVDEKEYIEKPEFQKLPKTQMKKIISDYEIIKKEFSQYLNGFKKMLRKNRISRSPLYRESSLINFKDQLLII